jgi:hypothetical protein
MRHLTKHGLSTPARLERIRRDHRHELRIEQPVAAEDVFDPSFARRAKEELDREGWRS